MLFQPENELDGVPYLAAHRDSPRPSLVFILDIFQALT